MKLDELSKLEPGDAMDVLIAKVVFQHRCSGNRYVCRVHRGPRYSTNLELAWSVFNEVCSKLFSVRQRFFEALQGQAVLGSGGRAAWPDVLVMLRDKMPEAICRAALVACWPKDESDL